MNIVVSFAMAFCFVLLAINKIINIRRGTQTLYEAVKFINLVKNNIRFSMMDYNNIIECSKNEGFSYVNFNEQITLSDYVDERKQAEFLAFTKKIGTTDETGQIALCEEYQERFKEFYKESANKEKSRVNVIGAIGILSVVCVLILGG
jgi:hypothetical protein